MTVKELANKIYELESARGGTHGLSKETYVRAMLTGTGALKKYDLQQWLNALEVGA